MANPTKGTTEVTEGIGGVAIATLSKVDRPTQPLGAQDMLTTPLRTLADSTGALESQRTIVEVRRVVHAPGRSIAPNLETDDGQTDLEMTCHITKMRKYTK